MNARIKWLRNQLLSLKLDGMIVFNPVNIRYLTGLSEEGFLIVAPKENIFVTDSRYIESVNRNLTIDDEIVAYNSRDLNNSNVELMTIEETQQLCAKMLEKIKKVLELVKQATTNE